MLRVWWRVLPCIAATASSEQPKRAAVTVHCMSCCIVSAQWCVDRIWTIKQKIAVTLHQLWIFYMVVHQEFDITLHQLCTSELGTNHM